LPDGISIPGLPSGQGGSDGSGWHGTETDGANTPGTIAGTDRGSGPHIHCVPRTPVFLLRKGIPGIPAAELGGTFAAVRRRCDGTSAVAGCDRAGEESLSVLRAAAVCGGTAQREMVPHGQRISGGGRRTDLGTGRRIRADPGDPSVTGNVRLRQGAAGGDGALPGAGF